MTGDSPTDSELVNGEADHDCRQRVANGHATQHDLYPVHDNVFQAEYECDECGRTVYLILEAYNVQISQSGDEYDGSVLEPHPNTDRTQIFDSDTLGPA